MLKKLFNSKKVFSNEQETLEDCVVKALFDPLKMRAFFEAIVLDAKENRATDVKLIPEDKTYILKYKVDGIYFIRLELPETFILPLGNTIRVFGKVRLDTRAHQTATFCIKEEKIRATIAPSTKGDIISLRFASKEIIPLDDLWNRFLPMRFKAQLLKPNGLILFTGPTGSGKTTLMHGCLSYLNETTQKSILSIEDAIEREFKGVSQFQVGKDETFGSYLKSALRQDSDVIMVGECLDSETAITAYEAVTTGHLVLTSAHSKDVLTAIDRMEELGISRKDIIENTNMIVSQRLVRRLCTHCKKEKIQRGRLLKNRDYEYTGYEANHDGCVHCREGYCGVLPILGILELTDRTREVLLSDMSNENKLEKIGSFTDYVSFKREALLAVEEGFTTMEAIQELL